MTAQQLAPVPELKYTPSPTPATDWGARPDLCWTPTAKLRVDRSYQRDILENGRSTARRIIQEFKWSRFGLLEIAPRPGGLFAIIDGQHRAAAAIFLGIPEVPTCIVRCSIEEEAEAFAAINGNVTKPSPLQIFNARLVAGDRQAKALRAVCDAAGVTIPRYYAICDQVGQSTSIGSLQACLRKFGAEALTRALKLIVSTGGGSIGLLRPGVIGGMCDLLDRRPQLVARPGSLVATLERTPIDKLHAKAKRIQALDGGSMRAHFAAALAKALDAHLKEVG